MIPAWVFSKFEMHLLLHWEKSKWEYCLYCTIFFCLPKQDRIGISESETCFLVTVAHSITAQSHYGYTTFSLIGFLKKQFVSENIDTGEVGEQWRTCSECSSLQPALGHLLLLTVQWFSHLFHLPWLGQSSPCTCYCRILLSMASQHFIFWWIVGFLSLQRKAPNAAEFSFQVQNRTEGAFIYLNGFRRLMLQTVWGAWSPHADFCLRFHDFWHVKRISAQGAQICKAWCSWLTAAPAY